MFLKNILHHNIQLDTDLEVKNLICKVKYIKYTLTINFNNSYDACVIY